MGRGRLKHHWKFYELSKLKLYRYPGLEEDVRVAVQEYAEFYKRYVA